MNNIEIHPFEIYEWDFENATTVIIGSFPCYNGEDYGQWFYSGSGRSDFWKLLSATFDMPADNHLDQIILCLKNKIAITDLPIK